MCLFHLSTNQMCLFHLSTNQMHLFHPPTNQMHLFHSPTNQMRSFHSPINQIYSGLGKRNGRWDKAIRLLTCLIKQHVHRKNNHVYEYLTHKAWWVSSYLWDIWHVCKQCTIIWLIHIIQFSDILIYCVFPHLLNSSDHDLPSHWKHDVIILT